MAVTNVRGRQLRDDDVMRADLNTTVSGSAVITRTFPGTGISLSSTGVDAGTGDVTIGLSTSGVTAGNYGSTSQIPVITVDAYGRITSISTSTAGGGGTTVRYTESFTATAGQTVFTVVNPLTAGYFDVYLNGVRLNTSSYSSTSTTITLVDGAVAGDIIDVVNLAILSVAATINGTGFVRASGTTVSYVTGTSSQFVKADGSLDSNSYYLASNPSGYITSSGSITGNAATATALQTARTINGVSFNGTANIAVGTLYDTNYKRIVNPGGGEYNPGGSAVTGALAVTLPVGFINSMIKVVISVYNYNTNTSFDVYCGGYVYSVGPTWVNVYAYITGPQGTDLRYNVRFGTNGTNPVIYIGETNTVWSYPQVYVKEVQVGHGNQSVTWTTGWSITAVTTLGTIHTTVSSAQLGYATSTNTAGAVVLRDASGNFTAGTITAALNGNAATVTNGLYTTTDQTITGQKTFPSAIANRPIFPGGIISLATGDADADIWGISEQYYPSNPTTADAWGIRWNAANNEIQFVGGGSNRAIIDLDQGNITGAAFIRSGGTASQFLKADGSVDSNTYLTANQSIAISGDASGSGTTAITLTLATVNANVGTFNNVTVNAKGLVTAASNVSYLTGNQTITVSGDATGSGTTSVALTLANSGVTAGTYTKVTVDAKGRVTVGASLASADLPTYTGTLTSTQVTTALGFTPENSANKGIANGYASLDATGKVPSTQLPSYVDDVLEYANLAGFPATGTAGVIYVAIDTNKTYRWSGSAYVEISASPGSTDAVPEGSTNLYFTNARARAAISLTVTGSSGASTYNSSTGVLNVPTYTLAGLGGEPAITAGTTAQYFRGDKTFQTLNTAAVPESGNLYYTDARARAAISLTVTGASGAATYSSATGVLNVPTYTLAGLGGLPLAGGTLTGQLISTLANNTATGGGQIYLNGASGNRIDFNTAGVAAPAFTTRSLGTKIVLYPNVGASTADYAIGIESSTLWWSVPQNTAHFFRWYGGTSNIATLTSAGALSLSSTLTATQIIRSGGTSTQFLKADGSVDSNTYYLASNPNGYTTNTGTVTTISILSANGFAGTVATATTTPAITLTTTITGLLKGNGTALSAAVAGTDYQAPLTNPVTGTGISGQISYWSGSSTQSGSATLTYTPTSALLVNNSVTAASAIARGINFTPTLIAAANNDVLAGLDVTPTFTNGAFTGVFNWAARFNGLVQIRSGLANNSTSSAFEITGNSGNLFYLRGAGDAYLVGQTPTLYLGSSGTFISNGSAYLYSLQATDSVFFTLRHNNNNNAVVAYSNGKVTLQESGAGNVIIGSATDSGLYKVDVAGNIHANTGIVTRDNGGLNTTYSFIAYTAGTTPVLGVKNGAIENNGAFVAINNVPYYFYTNSGYNFIPNNQWLVSNVSSWVNIAGSTYTSTNTGGVYAMVNIAPAYVDNGARTGSPKITGLYYNPSNSSYLGTDHYAAIFASGLFQIGNLGGTGTRMVVADANGVLSTQAIPSGGGSGTVTSVSVVSANGFAGTVATATTTPAITISTTVTGLLKGNGTAISAAVAGTDYQAPLTNPVTGTGATGLIAYWNGTNTQTSSANLVWDNTNSRLGIGTPTPGFAVSLLTNENTTSGYEIKNNSTGTAANAGIVVRNSATSGQLFKLSTGYTTYKTLVASDLGFYNSGAGDISIFNDWASGAIKFTAGGSTTAQLTIASTGAATFTNQIISTQANNAATGSAQIYLNGATGNRIDFNLNGLANPAVTTRSAGTKILLRSAITGTTLDYAIGMASGVMWISLPSTANTNSFRIISGSTLFTAFNVTGDGNVSVGNVLEASTVNALGSIQALNSATLSFLNSDNQSYIQQYASGSGNTSNYTWTYAAPGLSLFRDVVWSWSANTATRTYTLPNASGTIPLSVNGQTADANGNITISTGGGSGGGYTVTSQTANYTETATSGTKIIKCDTTGGAFTVTLPTAVSNQATIIIKKTAGTAILTVDGAGSETIDGGLTADIYDAEESITLVSDNANWLII